MGLIEQMEELIREARVILKALKSQRKEIRRGFTELPTDILQMREEEISRALNKKIEEFYRKFCERYTKEI